MKLDCKNSSENPFYLLFGDIIGKDKTFKGTRLTQCLKEGTIKKKGNGLKETV